MERNIDWPRVYDGLFRAPARQGQGRTRLANEIPEVTREGRIRLVVVLGVGDRIFFGKEAAALLMHRTGILLPGVVRKRHAKARPGRRT
ncbi:MAG: hypothetical protein ACRDJC_01030 [Thermomicrobiales bacterium]